MGVKKLTLMVCLQTAAEQAFHHLCSLEAQCSVQLQHMQQQEMQLVLEAQARHSLQYQLFAAEETRSRMEGLLAEAQRQQSAFNAALILSRVCPHRVLPALLLSKWRMVAIVCCAVLSACH